MLKIEIAADAAVLALAFGHAASANQLVAPADDEGIMHGSTGFQHVDCGGAEKSIALPPVTN
jgi:hypothetical protein